MPGTTGLAAAYERRWGDLLPIGRQSSGGYRRFAWTREDAELRSWFAGEAMRLGLDLTVDRAGNQWAWWGDPDAAVRRGDPGVVAGSHLDSVPEGGAYDGPLGVIAALAVLEHLQQQGFRPHRPVGVVNFVDEEGARFGIACAGSRVITGALDADRARGLTDQTGTTLADAVRRAGGDVDALGPDPEAVRRIGCFVELHIEQGRGLVDLGRPTALGSMIWPHGRWRVDLTGRADHAGTTRLGDRHDPMLDLARLITDTRSLAERHGVLATCGKVVVTPNGVNAIPSGVSAWIDARGAEAEAVERFLGDLDRSVPAQLQQESWTPATPFAVDLTDRLAALLEQPPVLATGAGHDAGILAQAGIPTAMIFVRNPTGISHSPDEHAETGDVLAGVTALAAALEELAR